MGNRYDDVSQNSNQLKKNEDGSINGRINRIEVKIDSLTEKIADRMQESQKIYTALFEKASMGIAIIDLTSRKITRANEALAAMLGYSTTELETMCFDELHPKVDLGFIIAEWEKLLQEKSRITFNIPIIRKSGEIIFIDISALIVNIDTAKYVVSYCAIVSERQKSYMQLVESEAKYRQIFQTAPVAMWELDISKLMKYFEDLKITGIYDIRTYGEKKTTFSEDIRSLAKLNAMNNAALSLFGVQSIEDFTRNLSKMDIPKITEIFQEILFAKMEQRDFFEREYTIKSINGQHIHVIVSCRMDKSTSESNNLLICLTDITKRKQAEIELEEREILLTSIFQVSPSGIGIVEKRVFKFVNDRICEITGYKSEELRGMDVRILYDTDSEYERVGRELYSQIGKNETRTVETKWKRNDGHIIYVSIHLAPLFAADIASKAVFNVVDISDRKQKELDYQYKTELESILTKISSNFINIPTDKIDSEILSALKSIGEFMGIDRSLVVTMHEDNKKFNNIFEWCAEGINKQANSILDLHIQNCIWFGQQLSRGEIVHVPDTRNLPPEAKYEKEMLDRENIKSIILIPIIIQNRIFGIVSDISTRVWKTFSDDEKRITRLSGEIIVNAILRKKTQEALEERIQFENMVSHISASFIKTDSEETSLVINRTLEEIGKIFHADIVSLSLVDWEKSKGWISNRWESETNRVLTSEKQEDWPISTFSWVREYMQKHSGLFIPDVEDIPEIASVFKSSLKRINTKSAIAVPIIFKGSISGMLAIISTKEKRGWKENTISSLTLVSEMMSQVVEREKILKNLKTSEEKYRSMFQKAPVSILEEDFMELDNYFKEKRAEGVNDFAHFFTFHPDEVINCIDKLKILEINDVTVKMFKSVDKSALKASIKPVFVQESIEPFKNILIALSEGKKWFESESVLQTMLGEHLHALLSINVIESSPQSKRVLIIITDISERKHMEDGLKKERDKLTSIMEELHYRLNLDSIITKLSADFINMQFDEIDAGIENAFKTIGDALKIDRIIAVFFNDLGNGIDRFIEWNIDNIKNLNKNMAQAFDFSKTKTLVEILKEGKNIIVPNITSIPTELEPYKSLFAKIKTKSILILPILFHGKLRAVISLSTYNSFRTWPDELILTIRVVNEILINAVEHRKSEQVMIESEEKYRKLVENSPNFIILLNTEGFITEYNQTTVQLFFETLGDIKGMNIVDLAGKICLEKEWVYGQLQPLIAGKKTGDVQVQITLGYDQLWVEFRIIPIKIKQDTTFLIVGRNITERKHAESLIMEELKKLKELDQIRSDFIIRVSHELKTPLNSIYGASNLLIDHYVDKMSPQIMDLVKIINKGGERLNSLVDSIIDLFRIESELLDLKTQPEDIVKIIRESVNNVSHLVKNRDQQLSLNLPDELVLNVDRMRFKQMLENIISNALNYTPPSGNIWITANQLGNQVEISVKDSGIGLTLEEKEKIFKKFGKIERFGQNFNVYSEGVGLGLYISKEIINRHGGTIWAESEGRNRGTTIHILLSKV